MIELQTEWLTQYEKRLRIHIAFVQEASISLSLRVREDLLRKHDFSKFSHEEFTQYARQFCGPADDPDGFSCAWLQHIHYNPHHWQHWIFPDGYTPKNSSVENGIVEMPRDYCLEMIADWLGSSMAYTNSWDITDWLYKNLGHVKLHSKSLRFVLDQLSAMGYGRVLKELGFYND
jgi:hypothetical protein